MSTAANAVRHRSVNAPPKKNKELLPGGVVSQSPEPEAFTKVNIKNQGPGSEWDYKLALGIITALAFLTRFWGISHPNEVVFDEVHFGKVCRHHSPCVRSVVVTNS